MFGRKQRARAAAQKEDFRRAIERVYGNASLTLALARVRCGMQARAALDDGGKFEKLYDPDDPPGVKYEAVGVLHEHFGDVRIPCCISLHPRSLLSDQENMEEDFGNEVATSARARACALDGWLSLTATTPPNSNFVDFRDKTTAVETLPLMVEGNFTVDRLFCQEFVSIFRDAALSGSRFVHLECDVRRDQHPTADEALQIMRDQKFGPSLKVRTVRMWHELTFASSTDLGMGAKRTLDGRARINLRAFTFCFPPLPCSRGADSRGRLSNSA